MSEILGMINIWRFFVFVFIVFCGFQLKTMEKSPAEKDPNSGEHENTALCVLASAFLFALVFFFGLPDNREEFHVKFVSEILEV